MRITKDKLYLIQPTTSTSDGVLWCEIVAKSFFTEFFFQGLQPDDMPDEEIIMELSTVDFYQAIRVERAERNCPTQMKLKLSREDYRQGDASMNETANQTKQPVIVIQLQLEPKRTGTTMTLTRDLKV